MAPASARLLARCALGLGVWALTMGAARPAHAGESLRRNVPAATTTGHSSRALRVASAPAAEDLGELRAELARVNAEIDALKRGGRNVRDDARLRARLADAEALARRLTEAERAAGTATVSPSSEVRAFSLESSPQDTPADLDAKADILTDRARRLGAAANQLEARLQAFRTRQELKRRAGQLDQDPFAAFEVSKRHVVASGGSALPPATLGHPGGEKTATSGGTAPPPSSTGDSTLGPAGPPSGSQGPVTSGDSRGAVSGGATPLPPSSGGIETSATSSLQFRDALDPATLADIRRLESSGSPAARALAMERALQALKAQRDALEARARGLRARAQAPLK